MESALEAIQSGQMLLQDASIMYGVPISTLVDQLCKCPTTTKRRRYSECDVENAIEAVSNLGLSVRWASNIFGVPKSTLDRKMAAIHMHKLGYLTAYPKVYP